ncbi:MAG: uroporphyrinogen decarboxylase family protein [Deltaproteobacteria bacterium]|nr:uroporphyrinogen decarboxylase family protein [Deltaproteobacteria bacterium]
MSYSPMKRFRDALTGTPRDRVPIVPLIGGWAAAHFSRHPIPETASDADLMVRAQIEAREAMGYDALFSYVHPLYIPEAFECRIRFLESGPLVDPLPVKMSDLMDGSHLPIPDATRAGNLPVILKATRGLSDYGNGEVPVVGLFEGPFTTACRIVEAEWIMRLVYKDPSCLEQVLDRITNFLIAFAQALIDHGADALVMPEPTASASMVSPKMVDRFILPRLRSIVDALDVPLMLHICGDTTPLLKTMCLSGAAVLSLDQCMDLSASRSAVPHVTLGGNVDPVNALLMGTPDKVEADTRRALSQGGKNRFILMSGCGIPAGCPPENIKTMIRTAKGY